VGFVVEKVPLGQVFSEYFGFPCHFSLHRLLHIHHLSSGAGTATNWTQSHPPKETEKNLIRFLTGAFNILRRSEFILSPLKEIPLYYLDYVTSVSFQNYFKFNSNDPVQEDAMNRECKERECMQEFGKKT
jgi:hypothetical protein